jgi:hypothetical protein
MMCSFTLLCGLVDVCATVPKSIVDNEYATATVREPKILLTTSRNPSAPLTQFVKVALFFWMGVFTCFSLSMGSNDALHSGIQLNRPIWFFSYA